MPRSRPIPLPKGWSKFVRSGVLHAISLGATAIVLVGGLVGGDALQWIWLAAFSVELIAAASAGQVDWKIDAGHFAERHGLILIIALGAGIIAVGIALEGVSIDMSLAALLAVGLAGVCAMWWAYFDRLQEVMESAMRLADDCRIVGTARHISPANRPETRSPRKSPL